MDAEIPGAGSGLGGEEPPGPISVVEAAPPANDAVVLPLRALAGLESGMVGGAGMLISFATDAWLHREYIWKVPHVFASAFYGDRIFRASFGFVTIAGVALLLALAGTVGILFGCLVRRPLPPLRLITMALLTSMLWYWVSQSIAWRAWIPLAQSYLAPSTMLAAHVVYGLCLARYSQRLRALARAFSPSAVLE
jgi:hypothetical protein